MAAARLKTTAIHSRQWLSDGLRLGQENHRGRFVSFSSDLAIRPPEPSPQKLFLTLVRGRACRLDSLSRQDVFATIDVSPHSSYATLDGRLRVVVFSILKTLEQYSRSI